jgi:hypothetical protein
MKWFFLLVYYIFQRWGFFLFCNLSILASYLVHTFYLHYALYIIGLWIVMDDNVSEEFKMIHRYFTPFPTQAKSLS